jgi:hypothetical protein
MTYMRYIFLIPLLSGCVLLDILGEPPRYKTCDPTALDYLQCAFDNYQQAQ